MEKKKSYASKRVGEKNKRGSGFCWVFFCVFYLLGLSESSRAGNCLRRRERKALGE